MRARSFAFVVRTGGLAAEEAPMATSAHAQRRIVARMPRNIVIDRIAPLLRKMFSLAQSMA